MQPFNVPSVSTSIHTHQPHCHWVFYFALIFYSFVRRIVSHCTFTWELFPIGYSYAAIEVSLSCTHFCLDNHPYWAGTLISGCCWSWSLASEPSTFLEVLMWWSWKFLALSMRRSGLVGGNRYWLAQLKLWANWIEHCPNWCLSRAWCLGRDTRVNMGNLLEGLHVTHQYGSH